MVSEMQLPELAAERNVTSDEITRFQADGHIHIKEVANAEEIHQIRNVILDASSDSMASAPDLKERDTYGKAFLKHMNMWTADNRVKHIVHAKRWAKIAADLLGVKGVRLYHDQALFKEAGGGYTPWHQDQYYWPLDTDKTVTMWMPLIDVTENMGILKFATASHHHGYLGELPISDKSAAEFEKFIEEKGYRVEGPTQMNAGDATFHYGWNLHAAPGNNSNTTREVMTIIWVADGCKVTKPINPNQERDMERWLPGLQVGDLVDSPLNPVVYP